MKALTDAINEGGREVTLDEALAEIDKASSGEHFVIQTHDGNAHVIPATVFEKVISGEMKLTDIDDCELIMRQIVQEWLYCVRQRR